MTKDRRVKILQNIGIITLTLISMYYINELFGTQLSVFKSAVNSILLPFGIALFLSYLLQPLVTLLEAKLKIKNKLLTIFIVFIIVIAVISGFLFLVGDIIYRQGVSFIDNDLDNIVIWFNTFIESNTEVQNVYNTIVSYINVENAQPVIFNAVNIIRGVGGLVVVVVLIPVFLFFLIKEKEISRSYKRVGKKSKFCYSKVF